LGRSASLAYDNVAMPAFIEPPFNWGVTVVKPAEWRVARVQEYRVAPVRFAE
jgi:hypothetical protein